MGAGADCGMGGVRVGASRTLMRFRVGLPLPLPTAVKRPPRRAPPSRLPRPAAHTAPPVAPACPPPLPPSGSRLGQAGGRAQANSVWRPRGTARADAAEPAGGRSRLYITEGAIR